MEEFAEDKKPDIVVWDKERGYYAKNLPYASDLGAPVIKADDVKGWRSREITNANHHFETKYNELREEFNKLIIEFDLNQFIYSEVQYSFIPIVGYKYHIYQKDDGSHFLSLIEPSQWKKKFIFTVSLDSNNKWIKIN